MAAWGTIGADFGHAWSWDTRTGADNISNQKDPWNLETTSVLRCGAYKLETSLVIIPPCRTAMADGISEALGVLPCNAGAVLWSHNVSGKPWTTRWAAVDGMIWQDIMRLRTHLQILYIGSLWIVSRLYCVNLRGIHITEIHWTISTYHLFWQQQVVVVLCWSYSRVFHEAAQFSGKDGPNQPAKSICLLVLPHPLRQLQWHLFTEYCHTHTYIYTYIHQTCSYNTFMI
jgi:hypothetical protein